jgi:hypothetical protein
MTRIARLTPQCLLHSLFRHSEATVAWGKVGGRIRSHCAGRFWSLSAYSHPRSRKHPTKTQPAVSFRLHNNNHGERNCRGESETAAERWSTRQVRRRSGATRT